MPTALEYFRSGPGIWVEILEVTHEMAAFFLLLIFSPSLLSPFRTSHGPNRRNLVFNRQAYVAL